MKILVLCTGNSCRSQMAEGFLKSFDNSIQVFSAGTQPTGKVHDLAIEVMKEVGIDLSANYPKSVDNFLNEEFDFVITVCDGAKETCPVFIGKVKKRIHFGFDDPADAKGSEEQVLNVFRRVRNEIQDVFLSFYEDLIKRDLTERIKVLFVCVHNSARSQMAEAFLNKLGKEKFIAESAGFEPGILNPLVVNAMNEIGIDISKNPTKSVFDLYKAGRSYKFVITVCDESEKEKCPIFPGISITVHWSFEDPSKFNGSEIEKLEKVRNLRNNIQKKVVEFIENYEVITYNYYKNEDIILKLK